MLSNLKQLPCNTTWILWLGSFWLGSFVLFVTPTIVHAAENGTTITGKVVLPPTTTRKASPIRGQGFVPRAKNPLRPPIGRDPRLEIVVFLEGGPVDPIDQKPHTSRYRIVGENFETDILPVVIGGKIEIKNMGRKSVWLYSESNEALLPSDPINEKGIRTTTSITELGKPIDLQEQEKVHFLAHIVAFESTYFSNVDHKGEFNIKGIPPGTWNIKIWFRDGWVTNIPAQNVVVLAKKPPKPITIVLPAKLITAFGK